VLRDPLFYAIVLGIMGPPAIGTLFIFHQAYLVGLKGWELTTFTAFFPFMSVTGAATGLGAGFFVDRLGAWRLMPVVLLPLALACLIVGMLTPVWAIPLMFLSFGLTQGMMNPVVGALWVELYGTAHLGAIRSSFRAGYGHAPARVAGASGE
jgi:sugar phosphate permease